MFFLILRKVIISPRKIGTNLSKYLLRTLFIWHINVVGAFVRPNGTTTNS